MSDIYIWLIETGPRNEPVYVTDRASEFRKYGVTLNPNEAIGFGQEDVAIEYARQLGLVVGPYGWRVCQHGFA